MTSSHPPPTGLEFDRIAARYDEARPSYPPALYSDLAALTGIRPGARQVWRRDYTAEQYIALLETFSSHLAMDPSARGALYAEVRERIGRRPGQSVTRHWLVILNVARTGG